MTATLSQKILKDRDTVNFKWMTHNLGRAEFSFCPVFKRNKLKELYIYPLQQENVDCYYKVECHSENLQITTYKEELVKPRAWIYLWCQEHKCLNFRVYVPQYSKRFVVEKLSMLSINFE